MISNRSKKAALEELSFTIARPEKLGGQQVSSSNTFIFN
jgi:hypothetical protein